jgi:hypothetical protein
MFNNTGNRTEVMNGLAEKTGGGLRKKDLKYNKFGKIVSKRMSAIAKKENRLQKGGARDDYQKRITLIREIEHIVNNIGKIEDIVNEIETLSIYEFKEIINTLEDSLKYFYYFKNINKEEIHELAKKAFHKALKTVGKNMQKQAIIRKIYLKFKVNYDSSDAIGREKNSSDSTDITTNNMNKIVSANKKAIEQLIFKK